MLGLDCSAVVEAVGPISRGHNVGSSTWEWLGDKHIEAAQTLLKRQVHEITAS